MTSTLSTSPQDRRPASAGPKRGAIPTITARPDAASAGGAQTALHRKRPFRAWPADVAVLAIVTLAVAAAWWVSGQGWLRPGDERGYRAAVVGGSMMLAVFLYPLRKQVRALSRLGATRWWLWTHIALGLAGPWLILVHSGFRIGSLNAGVALWSMVVVVLSGIVGRFLHARVHRGLHGEHTTLDELRRQAGGVEADAAGRLQFAPEVASRLAAFERRELPAQAGRDGAADLLRRLAWLPLRRAREARQCRRLLRLRLRESPCDGTDALAPDLRSASRLVDGYLGAVVRVAQFTAWTRVFALWHVAHVPFVVLLVVSAVVHVVAVHAY